jgi:hypothetical protein
MSLPVLSAHNVQLECLRDPFFATMRSHNASKQVRCRCQISSQTRDGLKKVLQDAGTEIALYCAAAETLARAIHSLTPMTTYCARKAGGTRMSSIITGRRVYSTFTLVARTDSNTVNPINIRTTTNALNPDNATMRKVLLLIRQSA